MHLRVLSLAAVAILALGAAPPTSVSTTPAAWTVTLRDSCPGLCAARTYTVDANGNASYAYGANLIPAGTQHPVTLDPAAAATIVRQIASAQPGAWVQTYIIQPEPFRAFAERQMDALGEYSDVGYMEPDVAFSPLRKYTLTMTRPGDGNAVKTALAEWAIGVPTAEPNDAIALAATIEQAFRPLVR